MEEAFVTQYESDTRDAGATYFLQYPKPFSSFILSPFGQQSCVIKSTKQTENDTVIERELALKIVRGGLKMTAKSWSSIQQRATHIKIIAVHGWLDSYDTFALLAPLIVKHFHNSDVQVTIIGYDQAGCGQSDHRSSEALITVSENTMDLIDVINALGWRECGILAHSFGAAISLRALASFPERFTMYMSIDAFGVFSQYHPHTEIAYQLRHAFTDRLTYNYNMTVQPTKMKERLLLYKQENANDKSIPEIYEDAAQNLCKRYRVYGLTIDAARQFVTRMISIPQDRSKTYWTYDPRLYHHMLPMPTENDILALIRHLTCPVLLIMADKGYPFDRNKFKERERVLKNESKAPFSQVYWLPEMRHHFHMSHPQEAYDKIIPFLKLYLKSNGNMQLTSKL
jgi:pimeloyl-ACP methyl ester carboxylesterase